MANVAVKNPKENPGVIMKRLINLPGQVEKAKNLLADGGSAFLSSVLDLFNGDYLLAKCDPQDVLQECWKAAALKLPVQKSLGYAYIIPYASKPQFQLGYRGLIQLAMRSGQYKFLNAGFVYEGETVKEDRLSGMITFGGEKLNDNPIGYFAYFELLNGFAKCEYWSKEKVMAHAERYSQAYKKDGTPWKTQFDAMALKTVIKSLIGKYGIMSIEFAKAFDSDNTVEEEVQNEVAEKGNSEPLTIPTTMVEANDNPAPVETAVPEQEEEDCGF